MRPEKEIIKLILDVASDPRIRAVLLNGSRANRRIKPDSLQDFDIIYVVSNLESFTKDHSWINVFGERIILQMPDEMSIGINNNHGSFAYLMLFKDGNRIDLTLLPTEKLLTDFKHDSLTIVLLDKDNLFENFPPPNDADYYIKKPSDKDFRDCCNEFRWVATYVAKGLSRKEIVYSKQMMEVNLRKMFILMIEWYIGMENNFIVSFGFAGKNIKHNVDTRLYEKILSTYPDSNIDNIRESMFVMIEIFEELSQKIADHFNFYYDKEEAHNVFEYLKDCKPIEQTVLNQND